MAVQLLFCGMLFPCFVQDNTQYSFVCLMELFLDFFCYRLCSASINLYKFERMRQLVILSQAGFNTFEFSFFLQDQLPYQG